jgi:hypothetical protein
MHQPENKDELREYRVWGRFTILEVMGGLAILGLLGAYLIQHYGI